MTVSESSTIAEYRTIERFTGYRFGSDCSVWSCWKPGRYPVLTDQWRRIATNRKKDGYPMVRITVDGVTKDYRAHRLILEAFKGPCPEGMECLHDDDNPSNLDLSNLRWGTRLENIEDSHRTGKFRRAKGSEQHLSKLTEKDIPVIRQLASDGMLHRDIAERFGVTRAAISFIIQGKTWNHVA